MSDQGHSDVLGEKVVNISFFASDSSRLFPIELLRELSGISFSVSSFTPYLTEFFFESIRCISRTDKENQVMLVGEYKLRF